jgi:hypothetical protein
MAILSEDVGTLERSDSLSQSLNYIRHHSFHPFKIIQSAEKQ